MKKAVQIGKETLRIYEEKIGRVDRFKVSLYNGIGNALTKNNHLDSAMHYLLQGFFSH